MPSRFPIRRMAASAREATPAPSAPNGVVTAVASGLSTPRSFPLGPDGDLYGAQSGSGTTTETTGPRSSVVKIVDGCPVAAASGLPSTEAPFKDVLGPMDVQFVGSQPFILPHIDHTYRVTLLWYVFR